MSEGSTQSRLLTSKDVETLIGWSRQHIAREERAGRFPKRVRIGPGSVRWPADAISDWIKKKSAESDVR